MKEPRVKPGAGRPLKFKTKEELQEKINAYFADCDAKNEPYLITGLALWLGTNREFLCNYSTLEKFSDAIREAKARVEAQGEKLLKTRGNAGDIFWLKNFGWKDKTETDVNISGNLDLGKIFE